MFRLIPLFSAVLAVSVLTGIAAPGADARQAATSGDQRRAVQNIIIEEAGRMKFPAALALAVAKVESDFVATVESHKGARGVMQIMPQTAVEEYAIEPAMLWQPRINIRLGIHFLKRLMVQYRGRTDLALSWYNGGSKVGKLPNARVLPYTRGYVNKVRQWQRRFQNQIWRRQTGSDGETWKLSRQPGVSWKPGRVPN
jgi:soluble lytic murein transglycosylase-like protein